MNIFSINGYWKNSKEEFEEHLVSDDLGVVNAEDDDEIFFYMTENDIKKAIEDGEKSSYEFVITSYEPWQIEV